MIELSDRDASIVAFALRSSAQEYEQRARDCGPLESGRRAYFTRAADTCKRISDALLDPGHSPILTIR